MSIGQYDCNNNYRLFDYDYLLKTLKHEIGHALGILHTFDTNNLMYSPLNPTHDFNPRNLVIPDYKHSDIFKDYSYIMNQSRIKVHNDDNVDLSRVMECFNTPPFLSYDWFHVEYRKIYYTLTGNTWISDVAW